MYNTTLEQAVEKVIKNYRIDVRRGWIYGKNTKSPVGSFTYEPRISVRLGDKKYNARISKVIGYAMFGRAALNPQNQILHINGNKFDNSGRNLQLKRKKASRTV